MSNVINLFDNSLKDIPTMLRKVAEQIESGEFGDAVALAMVVDRDIGLDVCISGKCETPADAHILLTAGAFRLIGMKYE